MEDRQQNTSSPEQTEQDALIAEMLRSAKGVELPSDLTENPVIHQGDETLPAPIVVSELKSGKYFYIFETDTGDRVPCLGYMLGQKLRQRLPNGKFRFTTVDPGIRPKRGTLKCMLHEDAPNRSEYATLGFRTCKKNNITNQYQLEQHMKHRHPQEWEAIERDRKAKERAEDRELQRLLITGATRNLVPQTEPTPAKVWKALFICDTCGADFGTQKTLDKHIQEKHK